MQKGPYKGRYKYKYRKGKYRFWKWGKNPFGDKIVCVDLEGIRESITSMERLSGEPWEQSKF